MWGIEKRVLVVLFSVDGAGSTAAGATILPLDGDLSRAQKLTAASMVAGGVILFSIGRALLNRSDASSTPASATTAALGEWKAGNTDTEVIAKCNIALAAWENSRTDATALATSLLEKEKGQAEADREQTRQAQETTTQKALNACVNCDAEQIRSIIDPPQTDTARPAEPTQPAPLPVPKQPRYLPKEGFQCRMNSRGGMA
jgi:hypothetical protein